jgi:hypothetical protein
MARRQVARVAGAATDLVCRFRAIASTLISLLKPPASPQLFPVRRVLLASRPGRQVSSAQVSPQLSPGPLVLQQRLAAQQVSQARRELPPAVSRPAQLPVELQQRVRPFSQQAPLRGAQLEPPQQAPRPQASARLPRARARQLVQPAALAAQRDAYARPLRPHPSRLYPQWLWLPPRPLRRPFGESALSLFPRRRHRWNSNASFFP